MMPTAAIDNPIATGAFAQRFQGCEEVFRRFLGVLYVVW